MNVKYSVGRKQGTPVIIFSFDRAAFMIQKSRNFFLAAKVSTLKCFLCSPPVITSIRHTPNCLILFFRPYSEGCCVYSYLWVSACIQDASCTFLIFYNSGHVPETKSIKSAEILVAVHVPVKRMIKSCKNSSWWSLASGSAVNTDSDPI